MDHMEMQKLMLRNNISINDIALNIHITKDAVKRYASGLEKIPGFVKDYLENLDGKK